MEVITQLDSQEWQKLSIRNVLCRLEGGKEIKERRKQTMRLLMRENNMRDDGGRWVGVGPDRGWGYL